MTWAQEVKKLDGYKCAYCGATSELHAHHIRKRSVYPDLAKDLENGITLCRKCHYTAHGGNYTNNGIRNAVFQSCSCSYEEMQAFIADYTETHIVVQLPRAQIARAQAYADQRGESLNEFIIRAIDETIVSDSKGGTAHE